MSLALALSSFSKTTTELIISQGVFYGLGASVAYAPTIVFMDEWFARRKGLAFGIMWVSFLSCSLHSGTFLLKMDRQEQVSRVSCFRLYYNGS
jgi:MFS family permease